MRAFLLLAFIAPFCVSCGTVHKWREFQTAPMTFGECYDGMLFLMTSDGLQVDASTSDRGLGKLQSSWRMRHLGLGRPSRFRFVGEVLIDQGSSQKGWPVRFAFEQQQVKDLRRSADPREEDWSDDGQDAEKEMLFAARFVRRIGAVEQPTP